jgi:hypothetical protein
MKSEITEILLPAGSKVFKGEPPTYVFLKAVLFCGLIFGASLAFYRYELKLQEMEFKVSELTEKVMELEHKSIPSPPEVKHRNKRSTPDYPWVVKSQDDNHVLYTRGDHDENHSTEEGLMRKRKVSQLKQLNSRRQGTSAPVRNHDDETFYTTDARGRRFYPSGLKEMKDRLPPPSSESMYTDMRHAPQVRSSSTRALPPLQQTYRRLGTGQNRVAARVVTFDDQETKSESVVAHFVADVSNFTADDNPRLRNSDGVFQIWKPEDWNTKDALAYDKTDGTLTVLKSGVYYLYAQIHYHDENVEGFKLEVNHKPVLQCTSKQEFNSCFTAGLTRINANDKIVVKNIGQNIFSIFKPEKSFFGLMRVSELQN